MAVKLGYKNVFRDPKGFPEWQKMGFPVESVDAGYSGAEEPESPGHLHGWGMIWMLLGIFAGGIALNLTPCVYPLIPITVSYFGGPFVLGLLTWVAGMASPWLGFIVFFTLSLGLGLPLFFLAVFSGNIEKLPRSGEWMLWVIRFTIPKL